jgi:hypothetical protein
VLNRRVGGDDYVSGLMLMEGLGDVLSCADSRVLLMGEPRIDIFYSTMNPTFSFASTDKLPTVPHTRKYDTELAKSLH